MFRKRKKAFPSVAFATCVWEKDWRFVLLDPAYLRTKQIGNHLFPFSERILVINNVSDKRAVREAAEKKIEEGVLTRYVESEALADEFLPVFRLSRSDFQVSSNSDVYKEADSNWYYYNALGPLCALYAAKADYLLYMTGDVRLDREVQWIEKAIRRMERSPRFKVANLVWNERYDEARKESYRRGWNFYAARQGFSDQMFLVKREEFCRPIYGEIRADSSHYPAGDLWEKRVFSAMKNRKWERLIYAKGSYTHENF